MRHASVRPQIAVLVTLVWMALGSVCWAQRGRPEVLLIRGGAGYWPGAQALADDLNQHGFDAKVAVPWTYGGHAAEIAEKFRTGRLNGPVTIVGYSSGADSACLLCGRLQQQGVPVSTLILIESTLGVEVPGNVSYCLNLYESRPRTDWIPAFRGIRVSTQSPHTYMVDWDVATNPQLAWLRSYNHFTLSSSPEARALVRNTLVQRQAQFVQSQASQAPPAKAPAQITPAAAQTKPTSVKSMLAKPTQTTQAPAEQPK